jgi:hypothetical protein
MRGIKAAVFSSLLLVLTAVCSAQFDGHQQPDGFKDKSMLHLPAGSKVAIIVFEDLGCPGCAGGTRD